MDQKDKGKACQSFQWVSPTGSYKRVAIFNDSELDQWRFKWKVKGFLFKTMDTSGQPCEKSSVVFAPIHRQTGILSLHLPNSSGALMTSYDYTKPFFRKARAHSLVRVFSAFELWKERRSYNLSLMMLGSSTPSATVSHAVDCLSFI